MNTTILESFLTVVQYKSFTQAARALQVTQPTISNHISTLEEIYGVELFMRDGKRATLTAAGRAMVPLAEKLLTSHKESIEDMLAYRPNSPFIRLGFTAQSSLNKLAKVMPKMAKQFPEQKIQLLTHYTFDGLVKAIHNKEIDFGFIHLDTRPIYTKRLSLWEEKIYFVLTRVLYQSYNESRNVYDYPYIGYADVNADKKIKGLDVDIRRLQRIAETNDIFTIIHFVINSAGIGLLPESKVKLLKTLCPEVIVVDAPGLVGTFTHSVIYDTELDLTPAKQYFLQLLEENREL